MLRKSLHNAVEEWIPPVDEEWVKTIRFCHYYPRTVQLEKYDKVNHSWMLRYFCTITVPTFVCLKKVIYLHNMVSESDSVTQVIQSGMLHGEDTVKKVWKHDHKTSHVNTKYVYFM